MFMDFTGLATYFVGCLMVVCLLWCGKVCGQAEENILEQVQ